jgi:hypothetical protein
MCGGRRCSRRSASSAFGSRPRAACCAAAALGTATSGRRRRSVSAVFARTIAAPVSGQAALEAGAILACRRRLATSAAATSPRGVGCRGAAVLGGTVAGPMARVVADEALPASSAAIVIAGVCIVHVDIGPRIGTVEAPRSVGGTCAVVVRTGGGPVASVARRVSR